MKECEVCCGYAACDTFTGGRKVISPGIAHAETITTFHSARFMEDPKAVEGELNTSAYAGTPTSLKIPTWSGIGSTETIS